MLQQNMKRWAETVRMDAMQVGRSGGLVDGIQIGRSEGIVDGIQIGRVDGIQIGNLQGQTNTLLRQLQRRFSTLPEWVKERVLSASGDELDLWTDRILDAQTLEELFGEEGSA
jgi:hypothetical protein